MPYNNAAIPPSDTSTGAAILPLARVKKTINADEEIGNVSAQAAFIITKATELFVQYAAEKAHEIARAETKPKRSLTYAHLSNAIARTDNLEFLSDLVPQTTTWRAHKERRAREQQEKQTPPGSGAGTGSGSKHASRASLDPKQTTLTSAMSNASASTNGNRGGGGGGISGPAGIEITSRPVGNGNGHVVNGEVEMNGAGVNGNGNGVMGGHYRQQQQQQQQHYGGAVGPVGMNGGNGGSHHYVNGSVGVNGNTTTTTTDEEGDVEMH